MSFGLLTLGTQSLQANQTALSVTGQNISNVNTEGYTRQRPVFLSREDQGGVLVDDIDRVADSFLNRQIWADSASYSSYDAFEDFANELDNLMASDVTSISTAMDDYFGALQTAVDDPVSLPNRELFIAQTDALVKRFNDLDSNIRRQNETVNGRLESNVSAINTIATHIAQLNDDIRIAKAAGNVSGELLDQRDAELENLSEYIGFTSIEQSSGEVSVFVGNGEPLVVGLSANSLVTIPSPADSSQLNIAIQVANNQADITDQISGGKVGGVLDYRNNILNESLDELGRIAMVFVDSMNDQHQLGMDLNGAAGGLVFTDINSGSASSNRVLATRDNVSNTTGTVNINDVNNIIATEYTLSFTSDSTFTLDRGSDSQRWTESIGLTSVGPTASDVQEDGQYFLDSATGDLTIRLDGFTLSLDSSNVFSTGDSYLIRPTRNAAAEIDRVINNASQLALANPLATSENVANTGTGSIEVSITDKDYAALTAVAGELTPPFDVSFSPLSIVEDAANTGTGGIEARVVDSALADAIAYPVHIEAIAGGDYTITDDDGTITTPVTPVGGVLTYNGVAFDITGTVDLGDEFTLNDTATSGVMSYVLVDAEGDRLVGDYVSGEPIALQGFEITITNQPALTDRFTVNLNTGGVSDNRNALIMSNLQFAKLIEGASYQDKYGQTVERVGTKAAVAQLNAQAGKSVLDSNKATRASIAGVNLDEEAAKLVQFQQAYQASAQIIRASQTIFDSLLQSI